MSHSVEKRAQRPYYIDALQPQIKRISKSWHKNLATSHTLADRQTAVSAHRSRTHPFLSPIVSPVYTTHSIIQREFNI